MIDAFRLATAVTQAGDGSWAGEVQPGWDIMGNANGGYLLAMAARAMRGETEQPDPVSITAHYLAPGRPGPVDIATRLVRAGRRFATVEATMTAEGRPTLALLGMFGDLGSIDLDDSPYVGGGPPDLPDPEDCISTVADPAANLSFMSRIDLRSHPEDAAFRDGGPSGIPRMRGWFRLRDDEPMDTTTLLCAADCLPPTTFNLALPVGWTPTLELTVHVRARPAPGWLACSVASKFVTGGFLEADGEIWDSTGRLVAQSRQLALVGRPT